MCITIAIASMVASAALAGVGTAITATAEANVANEQLRMDMMVEETRARGEMANRLEEYNRMAATNRVAVAVAGGTNLSFNKGIQPYNEKVANKDVATIKYNKDMLNARAKYGIRVNSASIVWKTIGAVTGSASSSAGTIGGNYLNRSG